MTESAAATSRLAAVAIRLPATTRVEGAVTVMASSGDLVRLGALPVGVDARTGATTRDSGPTPTRASLAWHDRGVRRRVAGHRPPSAIGAAAPGHQPHASSVS